MARPMINHRGPEFKALLAEIIAGLRPIFGTAGDIFLFPASGTGGMEAAVVNTLSPGDRVLAVSTGYFGDRFARIAADFGADVVPLNFPWGQAADPEVVRSHLRADPQIKAVLLTHNETSTGVTNDVRAVAAVVQEVRQGRDSPLIIVDAISSFAALPLPADELGLDVVVACSQKALMLPPGLALLSVSPRAWEAHSRARMPRHYWDFTAAKRSLEKGQTPYTPAISLLYGLVESLRLIHEEGLEAVYARHRRIGAMTREGIRNLGLSLFADPDHASDTVTAVRVPEETDGKLLVSRLRQEHNVVVAGGQGHLEGKIFRIGHLGWVQEADITAVLQALSHVIHTT